VHVTFTVAASGAAGGIGIARSSGNTAIDQAGLETVARAAPFPAIPSGAGRQSWTFTVPLAFVR
jgi:periplasmic protein TonB